MGPTTGTPSGGKTLAGEEADSSTHYSDVGGGSNGGGRRLNSPPWIERISSPLAMARAIQGRLT